MLALTTRLMLVSFALVACAKGYTPPMGVDGNVEPPLDSAVDVIARDVSFDAFDAAREASTDATADRGVDVAVDRGVDVAVDRGVDVAVDRGVDVAVDRGVDLGVADQGADLGIVDSGPSTQEICGIEDENRNLVLTCPPGMRVSFVLFASYGRPSGTCFTSLAPTSCHYTQSQSVVSTYCADRTSCTIPATNGVFGDDCRGDNKRLAVRLMCARP